MSLVGSLVGGGLSYFASQQAADAREDASEAQIAEQRRQFNRLLEIQEPYRQVGTNALYQQAAMMGLGSPQQFEQQQRLADLRDQLAETDQYITQGGQGAQGGGYSPPRGSRAWSPGMGQTQPQEQVLNPEYERLQQQISDLEGQQGAPQEGGGYDFTTSPGYEFRMQEGMDALENQLAATGNRLSGRAIKAAQRFGQGIASEEFGQQFNRLSALSGRGQTATGRAGQAAMSTGQGVANALGQRGAAQAGAWQGFNQAAQGTIGNIIASNQYDELMNRLNQSPMPQMSGPYGVQAGR